MKPICTRNVEIYHKGIALKLEIEEYKTLYHVHFIDSRKFFGHLHTITFKKYKSLIISDIVNHCYHYALIKRYF